MPHIHTNKGEHDLTVTAFLVRIDTPEPKVLLHMHRKLHTLLPAGGHVELTETPWQAIAHELQEESGYDIDQLSILQPKTRMASMPNEVAMHPIPLTMNTHSMEADHFHTDLEYGFVAHADPTHSVEEGESTDLRWLTKKELNKLDSSEIFDNTRAIYNFLLDKALKNWEAVPTTNFAR